MLAIVSDVVPMERRAAGMGIIMTAFSAAAALGVPFGLKLAQWSRWEAPFLAVACIAAVVWVLLFFILPPVRGHLEDESGLAKVRVKGEFLRLLQDRNAWLGLALMSMAVVGHFTVIPYLSPYLVNNMGLPEDKLFLVYLIGGLLTIFTGPVVGKLADRLGRLRVYTVLVFLAAGVILTLTHAGRMEAWQSLIITACLFLFASARFIPVQAVVSTAVKPERRGAYMSLISCSRDFTAGISAAIGGMIIVEGADKSLLHYDWLGWLAVGVSVASLLVFRKVRELS